MSVPHGWRGPTAYNPRELSKDELVKSFVVREELLARLLKCVRSDSGRSVSQHHLIVGVRGMGKTTVLHRLRYAIEDDAELAGEWLPITFHEEQFNVDCLSKLFLNCLDALCDRLEDRGMAERARAIDAKIDALPAGEAERSAAAHDLLLAEAGALDKRFVLLIDNFAMVVERLTEEEAWRLRSLLQNEDRLLLVAASPYPLEEGYAYAKPFYDSLRKHLLEPLSDADMASMILRLAEVYGARHVAELVKNEPSRVKTLNVLAGGNPRFGVVIYEVFAQRTDDDIESQLERALDRVTPLYKARTEELPPQLQKLFDAIAVHWDPISAGELADKAGMDVNAVSAQLQRLIGLGVVEKVPYDPPTKTGFQIAERFFNVWYMMRCAPRRVRRRLAWLVDVLYCFYGTEGLARLARMHLSREWADSAAYVDEALLLSRCVKDAALKRALEMRSIHGFLNASTQEDIEGILDLEGRDAQLKPLVSKLEAVREIARLVEAVREGGNEERRLMLGQLLIGSFTLNLETKLTVARNLQEMSGQHVELLIKRLHAEENAARTLFGEPGAAAMTMAFRQGFLDRIDDVESADAAGEALGQPVLRLLARAFARLKSDDVGLDEALRSTPDGDVPNLCRVVVDLHKTGGTEPTPARVPLWLAAAGLLRSLGWGEQEEAVLGRVTTIDLPRIPALAATWSRIAQLRQGRKEWAAAAQAFERSLQFDDSQASAWCSLAISHIGLGDRRRAAAAIERALSAPDLTIHVLARLLAVLIEHDDELTERVARDWAAREPSSLDALRFLGGAASLLRKHGDAVAAYNSAVTLAPERADLWISLADELAQLKRFSEAAQAAERASALNSSNPDDWLNLGRVLNSLERPDEAENALRRGTECKGASTVNWAMLAAHLADHGRHNEAARALRHAVEIDPRNARRWMDLSDSLAVSEDRDGAIDAALRARAAANDDPSVLAGVASRLLLLDQAKEAEDALGRAFDPRSLAEGSQSAGRAARLPAHLGGDWVDRAASLRAENNAHEWRRLGYALRIKGRLGEALSAFANATAMYPAGVAYAERAETRYLLGAVDDETEQLARRAVEIEHERPEFESLLAAILVRRSKWREAVGLAETFLRRIDSGVDPDTFKGVLLFFHEAVTIGYTAQALDLLKDAGLREAWRPLWEALVAIKAGNKLSLRRLAPEVRRPAEEMIAKLAPGVALADPQTRAEIAEVRGGGKGARARGSAKKRGRRRRGP